MTSRVLVYARYSSDAQRDASIEDQVRICRARADREGWDIREVYADHAISGATTLRPGYQAMLAAIRAGGIDIVLTESLDRLSRDLEHIASFFKQVGFARTRIVTLAEGEISELHIGLKGTMGALYLKDLAQKTHRGLEGRIRNGRSAGPAVYGYQAVRSFGPDGEPERGLRAIDPVEARIVRRIFRDYAAGVSPIAIARSLNDDGIAGPSGAIWYDATIRGRPTRGDGLLRNPIYAGRLVWNRHRNMKDPRTGQLCKQRNSPDEIVEQAVPELRIIDPALWGEVQARLVQQQAAQSSLPGGGSKHRYWEKRRPRHLLSGKVFCGCCDRPFSIFGKDYLGCLDARHGTCRNIARVRRGPLEERVLDALARQLMQPEHIELFIREFTAEWNRLASEATAGVDGNRRELAAVERKLANLIDAIAEGVRASGLQAKLAELETRRASLQADIIHPAAPLPALHPNLAGVYRDKLDKLREALQDPNDPAALEAARALIDRVIVTPTDDDGPPGIELVGELTAMLRTAGFAPAGESEAKPKNVLSMFASSVKAAPRGRSPSPCFPSHGCRLTKRGDLRGAVAEFLQNFFGVLSEHGRRGIHAGAAVGEFEGRERNAETTFDTGRGCLMMDDIARL